MANPFSFLGDAVKGTADFIEDDPGRFQILAGGLGKALGTGSPTLEALGSFAHSQGVSTKLEEKREEEVANRNNMITQLLGGGFTPKGKAGLTKLGIESLGEEGGDLKLTAEGSKDLFGDPETTDPLTGAGATTPGAVPGIQPIDINQFPDPTPEIPGPGGTPSEAPFDLANLEIDPSGLLGSSSVDLSWVPPDVLQNVMKGDQAEAASARNFFTSLVNAKTARRGQASKAAERDDVYIPWTVTKPDGSKQEVQIKTSQAASLSEGRRGEVQVKGADGKVVSVPRSQLVNQGQAETRLEATRFENLASNAGQTIKDIAVRHGTKATTIEEMFSPASDWSQKLNKKIDVLKTKDPTAWTDQDKQDIQDFKASRSAMLVRSYPSGIIPQDQIHPTYLDQLSKTGEAIMKAEDGLSIKVRNVGGQIKIIQVY